MKRALEVLTGIILLFAFSFEVKAQHSYILQPQDFSWYADYFSSVDDEIINTDIPNKDSWEWMQKNIPLFECPDKEIEQIYYYRWWVYRKHIKESPSGYVITEFLPEVSHSSIYNTIVCAAGLHVDEGKWLRDRQYVSDYLQFWFSDEGEPRQYSTWLASSVYAYCLNIDDFTLAEDLFVSLVDNYKKWEEGNLHESGLFWSNDDRDGGEYSISGSGLRPTLNSYMYADAMSISRIASRMGNTTVADEFKMKAEGLKQEFQDKIWDPEDNFFCAIPLDDKMDELDSYDHRLVSQERHVRELYGFFPWKFMLPDAGYEGAWEQILDQNGFFAPFGSTTAEQRHPLFMKNRIKRCQWDGSTWPFASSIALGGMINLLHHYNQDIICEADFLRLMKIYAHSQHRILPYGDVIPWIGESLHPHSGIWLSRAIALEMKIPLVKQRPFNDKNHALLRGKDYNHSSYCDLVISGLVGLEIKEDGIIRVDPLIPEGSWSWFCLDGILYQDKIISIVYDKDGSKYELTPGLTILVDGKKVAHSKMLDSFEVNLQ